VAYACKKAPVYVRKVIRRSINEGDITQNNKLRAFS